MTQKTTFALRLGERAGKGAVLLSWLKGHKLHSPFQNGPIPIGNIELWLSLWTLPSHDYISNYAPI